MILPKFTYKKVKSVAEAVAAYNSHKGKAKYLAGGTDLVPLMKLRLSTPAAVIDLKDIAELKAVSRKNDGWLAVGANVTLFALKNDPVVKEYFPALYESLDATSCETLQMRGTIGGNILQDTRCLLYNQSLEWRKARGFCYKMGGKVCNVVPNAKACFSNYCSDNAPSLITLSAQLRFVGPKGERTAGLEDIFSGDGRRPLTVEPGEILTEILIPLKKTKGAYEKLRVRDSIDYPLAGVAVSAKGGTARACVCGIGLKPRVYDLSDMNEATVKEAADRMYGDAKPVSNTVLSAMYRKKMAGVLFKKAVKRVLQEG